MEDVSGKPATNGEADLSVKGLGKQFKVLKIKNNKKSENTSLDGEADHLQQNLHFDHELKELLSEEAFSRLKESGTGLHLKVRLPFLLIFTF